MSKALIASKWVDGLSINPGTQEAEHTDIVANTLAIDNIPTAFPFYTAAGASDTVTITNNTIPFYKADGTLDTIGVS